MHEIIVLNIGECGNKMGAKFWEYICHEHGVTNEGKLTRRAKDNETSLDVYFHQTLGGPKRYVPRSILVDLEPTALNSIRSGPLGSLFRPDNFINGQFGASNCFGKGYYDESLKPILEQVLETIRNEIEICDYTQGIQITHAIGGGTGSGLTSLIIQELSKQFADKILCPFTVFPSPKISDVVVEPYNAVLALQYLTDETEMCVCMDNEALYDICTKQLKLKSPSYADMNHIIAAVMGGTTASLRFPGSLNSSLRKIATNMVHSPKLHFFTSSYAPLNSRKASAYSSSTVSKLTMQLFDGRNMQLSINPADGKYFTCCVLFRGNASMQEIDETMQAIQLADEEHFIQWIPNNIQRSVCRHPSRDSKLSATLLANTSAISQCFTGLISSFKTMYENDAFIHWFDEEGVEPAFFDYALECLSDVSSTYEGVAMMAVEEFA